MMMMNRRSLAFLLTAASLIAAPSVADAQPAAPQEPAASAGAVNRSDAARELFQRGLRLYTNKQFAEAERALLSAWEMNPTYDVAYNLGLTEYQLKKHKEAAQYLSFALRHWPLIKGAAQLKPEAEQRLAVSRAQVGALVVSAGVAGAEVLVDGKVVGKAPLDGEVFVEAGEHLVEARLEGYEPAKQSVKVDKGATAEVALALVPVKREVGEGPAMPGAQGGAAGTGAPHAERSPAGPVEPVPPPPPEKRSWVPVIALGAASVVGLGVGVGTTVASNAASGDAHEQSRAIIRDGGQCVEPPPSWVSLCNQVRSDASSADTFANVARVAYIASGAFAIAAATYALWPKPASAESVTALPLVHQGGAGIVVVGAW